MGGGTWLSRAALIPDGMRRRHLPVALVISGEAATAAATRPVTLPCSPSAETERRERAGSLRRVPWDEADGTVSGPSFFGSILTHLPDACLHFHGGSALGAGLPQPHEFPCSCSPLRTTAC